ncbi:MAG: hypothetical protein B7X31_10015 [Thiomonas sp. 13-66-29]|jgi:uncharacterized protein (DUF697 family)|nr:MAG: hypothetical protein B7X31_10015 [Thiomonas sp. 13-66-29]
MAKTGIHAIIHSASVAAGGVGAGLAQIPGSDAPVLTTIQSGMILAIAHHYGHSLTKAAAVDMVMTFAATMAGRGLSQVLIGWLPGIGNAINAATASALTEAVGWSADSYFAGGRSNA